MCYMFRPSLVIHVLIVFEVLHCSAPSFNPSCQSHFNVLFDYTLTLLHICKLFDSCHPILTLLNICKLFDSCHPHFNVLFESTLTSISTFKKSNTCGVSNTKLYIFHYITLLHICKHFDSCHPHFNVLFESTLTLFHMQAL